MGASSPALNGHKGILFASFESVVRSGAYLRATRDGPAVAPSDGTAEFADDASFKLTFNNGGSFVLESIGSQACFFAIAAQFSPSSPPTDRQTSAPMPAFLEFRLIVDSAGHPII